MEQVYVVVMTTDDGDVVKPLVFSQRPDEDTLKEMIRYKHSQEYDDDYDWENEGEYGTLLFVEDYYCKITTVG
jgi:hypothetical protein